MTELIIEKPSLLNMYHLGIEDGDIIELHAGDPLNHPDTCCLVLPNQATLVFCKNKHPIINVSHKGVRAYIASGLAKLVEGKVRATLIFERHLMIASKYTNTTLDSFYDTLLQHSLDLHVTYLQRVKTRQGDTGFIPMIMRIQQLYNKFVVDPPHSVSPDDGIYMIDISTEVRLVLKLFLAHGGSYPSKYPAKWNSWLLYLNALGWHGYISSIEQQTDSDRQIVIHSIVQLNRDHHKERVSTRQLYEKKIDTLDAKLIVAETNIEGYVIHKDNLTMNVFIKEQQLGMMHKENDMLTKSLHQKTKELNNIMSTIHTHESSIKHVTLDHISALKKISQLQTENLSINQKITIIETHVQNATKITKHQFKQLVDAKHINEMLTQRYQDENEQNKELVKLKHINEMLAKQFQQKNEELVHDNERLTAVNDTLSISIQDKNYEITTLSTQLQKHNEINSVLLTKLQNKNIKNNSLSEQLQHGAEERIRISEILQNEKKINSNMVNQLRMYNNNGNKPIEHEKSRMVNSSRWNRKLNKRARVVIINRGDGSRRKLK
jgi:hypothetical protein